MSQELATLPILEADAIMVVDAEAESRPNPADAAAGVPDGTLEDAGPIAVEPDGDMTDGELISDHLLSAEGLGCLPVDAIPADGGGVATDDRADDEVDEEVEGEPTTGDVAELSLLDRLDRRQNAVLQELDQLNQRIDLLVNRLREDRELAA